MRSWDSDLGQKNFPQKNYGQPRFGGNARFSFAEVVATLRGTPFGCNVTLLICGELFFALTFVGVLRVEEIYHVVDEFTRRQFRNDRELFGDRNFRYVGECGDLRQLSGRSISRCYFLRLRLSEFCASKKFITSSTNLRAANSEMTASCSLAEISSRRIFS